MTHPQTAGAPEAEAIRAQLQRVLASAEFANAGRMRRFLELVVSDTLEGRAGGLKEYTIGVSVFDRPASFDPGIDPIVRVEARRLRAKLDKYYAGDGRAEPIVIELPKGRYTPRFRHRDAAAAGAPAESANTVAVLPFQNLNPSAEAQHFCDGLTWELIHQLTRREGLSVVAWNSVSQVREPVDAKSAAARLKAGTLLTGSVRQSGDRLRIIAQLIDAGTGVYLWSETYDRRLQDIFSIQDDIARAIVSRLQGRSGAAEARGAQASRYSVDAYQLYLRGRAHWNLRTAEGLLRSLDYFRRSTELDGNFALGYAGLADAYALLADYGLEPPSEGMPASKRAATRALEIDPSLGEAHCSLAFLSAMYEWKWAEAEEHFRHALALNPGYATAHHWLGTDLLANLGRFEEALDEIDIARQLDPLSPVIGESRGYTLMLARRWEEAAAHFREMAVSEPSFFKVHTTLGRTLMHMGRYDEAIASLNQGRQVVGWDVPTILGAMGQAYALKGERDEAVRLLNQLSGISRTAYVPSTSFALVHIGLGEKAKALEWLERGLENRELPMTALAVHPGYDPLRSEPAFQALLRRMGLIA